MPISPYPRFGFPIAPKYLAPLLEIPPPCTLPASIQSNYARLADIDESVWKWLTAEECITCGDAIIDCITQQRSSRHFDELRFPAVPDFVSLDMLDLESKTFNCLAEAAELGTIQKPSHLQGLTANELLTNLRGFGIRCLVDLFSSLENFTNGNKDNSELPRLELTPIDGALTRLEIDDLLKNPPNFWPRDIGARHLPPVSSATRLDDLQLKRRRRNCLVALFRENVIESISGLSRLTVQNLLDRQNFGRGSLLDLLEALSYTIVPTSSPLLDDLTRPLSPTNLSKPLSPALTKYAERLRDLNFARVIRCDDLRFGPYLRPIWAYANATKSGALLPSATHLQAVAHRLVGREFDTTPDEAIALVQKARNAISAALRLSLEKELSQLVAKSTQKARGESFFLQYHGWDGGGGSTLQGVGDRHRLTRERVRQIVSSTTGLLRRSKPFTPVLDRILAALSKNLPISEREATELLRRRGLISGTFLLDGVVSAAKMLGKSVSLCLEGPPGARVLIHSDHVQFAKLVSKVARKAVSKFGLSTIEDVCSRLTELTGTPIESKLVSPLLRREPRFCDLGDDSEWFWFKEVGRNHLVHYLEKIFSIAPRIHASELRSAISSDIRGMGYAPPARIVLEFCRQACSCEIDSQFVINQAPSAPDSILSPSEMIMFNVLSEYGPLISRNDLEERCTARGMNLHTFGLYVGRCPIVARYATSLYGLRGVDIAPGEVERLTPKRERTSLYYDHGWSADAKPWVLCELSRNVISSGVFSIPAPMRDLLEGRFVLFAEDHSRLGTLVVAKQASWGLGPLFRRRGGESGDTLLLYFDLRSREVVARLGVDRNLIEEDLASGTLGASVEELEEPEEGQPSPEDESDL